MSREWALIDDDGRVVNVVVADGDAASVFAERGDTRRWIESFPDNGLPGFSAAIGQAYCEEHASFACSQGCDYGDFLRSQTALAPHEQGYETFFMGRRFLARPDLYTPPTFCDMDESVTAIIGLSPKSIADVGAGIGTLGITVGAELGCAVTLVEPNVVAAEIARENMNRLGVAGEIIAGDCGSLVGIFDVIVADIPWFPTSEANTTGHSYAADGGVDGLDVARDLLVTAQRCLKDNGTLVVRKKVASVFDTSEWEISQSVGETVFLSRRNRKDEA